MKSAWILFTMAACGYDGAVLPPQAPMQSRSMQEIDGTFEVECRFGISACENQAAARCKYAGYRIVSSYRTIGPLGPYWYAKMACGKDESD
jgi:hypothetical protein